MSDPQKPQAFPIANLPHTKSPQFVSVYTNTVAVSVTFWDILMIFGHVLLSHEDVAKEPHIEDSVGLTMSWEHAKALANALTTAVENYEKEHGPIRAA